VAAGAAERRSVAAAGGTSIVNTRSEGEERNRGRAEREFVEMMETDETFYALRQAHRPKK